MRLVTWNIHGAVGTDRRHDLGRIAEVLAELDADIVGLQEVDWRRAARSDHDPLELLADELGMQPVAGPNLHDHAGGFGNGLLVRGSVLEDRRIDLAAPGREPRGAIDVDLLVRDRRVRTIVTHLGLGRIERRRQLRQLHAGLDTPPETARTPDVIAILADLNEWIPLPRRRDILRRFHLPIMIGGRSFPSRLPMFSLDRILLAPAELTVRGHVVRTPLARVASDHLPVLADVQCHDDGADPGSPRGVAAAPDAHRSPGSLRSSR